MHRTLRPGVLPAVAVALAACMPPATVVSAGAERPPAPPPTDVRAAATRVVELANEARRDAGHPGLAMDRDLMRAAQLHAEQMAGRREMAHVLPEARYPELRDRLRAVGYEWRAIAENIAAGSPSPEAAVSGWVRSRPHRENMFSRDYTAMGAGYAVGRDGRPYWVQVFARPLRDP